MTDPVERYRENVGRDPVERFPADHPERWQWDYRGSKAERAELAERLEVPGEDAPASQEESLFDDLEQAS